MCVSNNIVREEKEWPKGEGNEGSWKGRTREAKKGREGARE